jgi:hypothetical protein
LPETSLDSVLRIRQSRTVGQDHTLRWDGVIYQIERKQITAAMRGARVQMERRLDGSTSMHWRNRFLPLQGCETRPRVIVKPAVRARATPERSAAERARAKQRILDARRRLSEAYAQLANRPIWQAMKHPSLQAEELR